MFPLTVDSVFAQPSVTSSLTFGRRAFAVGTLYLTIYVICHVAIVILDVSFFVLLLLVHIVH